MFYFCFSFFKLKMGIIKNFIVNNFKKLNFGADKFFVFRHSTPDNENLSRLRQIPAE